MLKNTDGVFYAVGRGREIGIYNTWKECKSQTEGIANAKYRKFYSLEEAEEFVNFWKNYSSPVKALDESDKSMESSETLVTVNKDSNACDTAQFDGSQPNSAEDAVISSHQQQSTLPLPCMCLQPLSSHSASFDGKTEQKSVDVLALNLRLDSFEKRFDACLKEVGSIMSQISHIKTEIKEIKESLSSTSNSSSDYSPWKTRDGMLQTTLGFSAGDKSPNKSHFIRPYVESNELDAKRTKTLKRKLSRSSSSENSKRFANDEDFDDLVSRIKAEEIDYESFTIGEDDYVEVYTDGASHGNGKNNAKAGIGIWWGDHHPLNVGEPVIGPPTNNTAEIQAARVAMELAVKSGLKKLRIFTDSEFLINCATKWMHRWKKNGWTLIGGGPVKNRKELEKLDKVASKISVRWEKVLGHAGIKGNEMADRLANEGATKYKS